MYDDDDDDGHFTYDAYSEADSDDEQITLNSLPLRMYMVKRNK